MTDPTVRVLRVMLEDPAQARYGRDLGNEAGLATGTVQPILARLEQAGWLESFWEATADHENSGRPRRRYYRFVPGGAQRARNAIARAHQGSKVPIRRLRPRHSD